VVFRGDVRTLPQVPQRELMRPKLEKPHPTQKQPLPWAPTPQMEQLTVPLAPMPAASQSFPGITRTDTCTGGQCGAGTPPDPNGAVGPNHYIQAVNSAFAIYSKTGTLLASFTENALWSGSGTFCEGNGAGDPVVIYDALADRWILTNLANSGSGTRDRFTNASLPPVQATRYPAAGIFPLFAQTLVQLANRLSTQATTIPSSVSGPTASTTLPTAS
jgi:hypothetical protein